MDETLRQAIRAAGQEQVLRFWERLTPEEQAEFSAQLAEVDWRGEIVRRDTVDLARTVGDRLALAAERNMMSAYFRWKAGDAAAPADFERAAEDFDFRKRGRAHVGDLAPGTA